MDPKVQPLQQGQTTGAQNPTQPVQQASQQPIKQQSVAPVVPIGGGGKEAPKIPPQEWVSSSTPEVVLPQEVKEAGVEVKPIEPTLPQSAQMAGVTSAKEATPVEPVKAEPLGMKTQKNVLMQLKNAHKKVTEGFSWLVRLIIKEQDKKERGTVL